MVPGLHGKPFSCSGESACLLCLNPIHALKDSEVPLSVLIFLPLLQFTETHSQGLSSRLVTNLPPSIAQPGV